MFFIAKKLKKVKNKIELKISEKIKNFEEDNKIRFMTCTIRGYLFYEDKIKIDVVTYVKGQEINPFSNIVFTVKYTEL